MRSTTTGRTANGGLFWCAVDDVPLLGTACSLCGKEGSPVRCSPSGEYRPAFAGALGEVQDLFSRQWGVAFPGPNAAV